MTTSACCEGLGLSKEAKDLSNVTSSTFVCRRHLGGRLHGRGAGGDDIQHPGMRIDGQVQVVAAGLHIPQDLRGRSLPLRLRHLQPEPIVSKRYSAFEAV